MTHALLYRTTGGGNTTNRLRERGGAVGGNMEGFFYLQFLSKLYFLLLFIDPLSKGILVFKIVYIKVGSQECYRSFLVA